jgi:tetratricopeptide (TPR) repeat protein
VNRTAVAAATVCALAAPATAVADASLPRFEGRGDASLSFIAGSEGPEDAAIAREVARRGFYAGAPVGVADCAGCHAAVAKQWSASAHRFSSFNNPYYRVATDQFREEKGGVASRFCGNCHEPLLVASGTMDRPGPLPRGTRQAQAGVTCLICHSVTHVDLEGNGRYLADLRPIPIGAGVHGARVRPPLMNQATFCAACHKVGLGADVTADRWLRGQDDYDAWHVSAVAGNGAGSVYRPAATQTCQDCHMPLEPATEGDAAAKNGMIRSHRFLGANTALPHLRGDTEQEQRVARNLRGRASLALIWSGPRRVDALLRARGVGHRFPGGTMDSNEVWLEVTAFDGAGRVIGKSGGRGRDGALDGDTHLVRAQPVDGDGRPLARRDPQHMRGVAFDAALAPSDPQVVRFEVPEQTARVEARLSYRKFSPAYARQACADLPARVRRRCLDLPIVEIAAATIAAGAPAPSDPAVLLDWGLALADATVDHADEARAPLEAVRAAWPTRVEPLLGLGRLAVRQGRTDDVLALAEEALSRAPEHPAPLWQAARALTDAYRFGPALSFAERLARRLPNDRGALGLLARARGLNGDSRGALAAADAVLVIDPESEEGFYQRALALGDLGRAGEAEAALGEYAAHRVALETDQDLRNRWRQLNPGHADESEPCHTHRLMPSRSPPLWRGPSYSLSSAVLRGGEGRGEEVGRRGSQGRPSP